jgi:hypothetical protein
MDQWEGASEETAAATTIDLDDELFTDLDAEEGEPEGRTLDEVMIAKLYRLRRVREELKQDEARSKAYLKMVKDRVEADLKAKKTQRENLEREIRDLLIHENNGEKYRVPGLGTAFIAKRTRIEIENADALLDYIDQKTDLTVEEFLKPVETDEAKLKRFAKEKVDEGEIVPGIVIEPTEGLQARFS